MDEVFETVSDLSSVMTAEELAEKQAFEAEVAAEKAAAANSRPKRTANTARYMNSDRGMNDIYAVGHLACRDEDPELFFPIGSITSGPVRLQYEEAVAVCRRCEAITPCFAYALSDPSIIGIWGGTHEDERQTLRRRIARSKSGL